MKVLTILLCLSSAALGAADAAGPTIVLVHGAFADGSSGTRVIPILSHPAEVARVIETAARASTARTTR